jgi:predicted regulator of Ras-like GTPase activity (Roadblock/LC7/MglB family)
VYAVGRFALLVVQGDRGLNIGRLLLEASQASERIAAIIAK